MRPRRLPVASPLAPIAALALLGLLACPSDGTLPPPGGTDDDDVDDDSGDDDSAADDDSGGDDDVTPPPCQDLDCDGWPDLVFANTEDGSGNYDAHSYVYWGSATGFDAADRLELPTLGAMGATVADFDADGWPDIAFASVGDGLDERNRYVDSMVYWGSEGGFSDQDRTLLPTIGAADVSHADVDGDGWLDLLFSNRYDGGNPMHSSSYQVDSYAYLGGPSGFSEADRLAIPTFGAARVSPCDLDLDGVLDLPFANGTIHSGESWIYWGVSDGFDPAARTSVPSDAAEGVTAGDLDLDGWPDLVISNFYSLANLDIDSFVYWGGPGGYSEDSRLELATHGATDAEIADLDADGLPDLVFANSMEGWFWDTDPVVDSAVFWGSLQGLGQGGSTPLPTTSASDVGVADLNLDGRLDLVFSNHYDAEMEPEADSFVYWGGAAGFGPSARTALPTIAAAGLAIGWVPLAEMDAARDLREGRASSPAEELVR